MTAVASDLSFELPESLLRARRSLKWSRYPDGIIPAWVAEMDFAIARPIQASIEKIAVEQDYGYPSRAGFDSFDDAVSLAFAQRMNALYGWDVASEQVLPVTEIVQAATMAVLAFTEPDEGIVLQLPSYPPFRDLIAKTGRTLITHPFVDTGSDHVLDQKMLAGFAGTNARLLLLCNPHNPTGRALSRDELEAIGAFAVENDAIIVSDEIHADLVFAPAVHVPIATLSPEVAARTVTITSPTKAFNLPGIRCGVMHFGSPALLERFYQRFPRSSVAPLSAFGVDAAVAAWRDSDEWLKHAMDYLDMSRRKVCEAVARDMPGIRCYLPEATYLAWLDCTELELGEPAFELFYRASVATSPGESFGADYGSFVRLNFACSHAILDKMLDRMSSAVRALAETRPAKPARMGA